MKLALNRSLGEALRRRFGEYAPSRAGGILRTRYERNGEDFLLFFLALSMPSRGVVLSYAAAEAGGTPMVRSPFRPTRSCACSAIPHRVQWSDAYPHRA